MSISPTIGAKADGEDQFTFIVSFTVLSMVVLGGMGYIPGALVGGLLLGVIQSLTATYLNSGLSVAVTFILLFVVLILKPRGIMGKGIVE